jgi:hypothetical protein
MTSEGFLVVLGKDQQQSELMFRKHMKRDDIYVHADVQGALSCFVFAKKQVNDKADSDEIRRLRVTPLAIQEAGVAVVCHSNAWSAKLLISAYWVKAEQVSKTDSTGCVLPVGLFVIYGEKNFLPPMPLEMGFGVMFCLDADSAMRHEKDRKVRSYDFDAESLSSSVMDRFQKYSIAFREEALEAGGENAAGRVSNDEVGADFEDAPETTNAPAESLLQVQDHDDQSEVFCMESQGQEERNEGSGYDDDDEAFQSRKETDAGEGDKPNAQKNIKSNTGKKKALNRKKARRYAEQDEEDVELAMMVLGHASKKSGKTLQSLKDDKDEQMKRTDLKARQNKAGVTLLRGDWGQLMDLMSDEVRGTIQHIVDAGIVKEGGIDADVMKDLSLMPSEYGLRVLNELRDCKNLHKISNKSSFLAGIVRTVRKDMERGKGQMSTSSSRSAKPKSKSALSNDMLEAELEIEHDEGLEEHEGDTSSAEADRNLIDLLTECPLAQDKILYAVPVCAPYISMQRFKYKIKLTPGALKKGKAAKQAMELLTRLKESTEIERQELKNITDAEVLAAIIGDVKFAAPGLHQVKQRKQRGQK